MAGTGRLLAVATVLLLAVAACGDDDDRSGATTPPVRDATGTTVDVVTGTTLPPPTPQELCQRLTAAEVSEVLGARYESTTEAGECEYNVPRSGRLVRLVAGYFDRATFLAFIGTSCPVEERDDGRIVATFCGSSKGTDRPNEVWFDLDGVGAQLKAPGGSITLDQYEELVEAARD